jgi:hypothetical protein
MPSEVDIGGSGLGGGGGKSKGKIEKSIEDGCCVECVGGVEGDEEDDEDEDEGEGGSAIEAQRRWHDTAFGSQATTAIGRPQTRGDGLLIPPLG